MMHYVLPLISFHLLYPLYSLFNVFVVVTIFTKDLLFKILKYLIRILLFFPQFQYHHVPLIRVFI